MRKLKGGVRGYGYLGDLEMIDLPAALVDHIGDLSRCRTAVTSINLHAEVSVRPSGVMAGGQDNAARGTRLADEQRGSWREKYAALSNEHAAHAIGCCHLHPSADGTMERFL